MSNNFNPNIPNLIVMVKPKSFGFNPQTAMSNSFQNENDLEDVSEIARQEFDQLRNLLLAENIAVKVFEDVNEGLPDSIFPNNWISHIPQQSIVIYPMLTENRQKEVREDVVGYLREGLDEKHLIDLRNREGKVLEGTGSIIFDHASKTAFGCLSPRTNLGLLKRLCDEIGYRSITFESVDLKGGQIYHTNVMLSIADKFAVVCLESIPDILERSLLKSSLEKIGKEVIDISYSQMNAFGANALEVQNSDGKSYYALSATAFAALQESQIREIEKSTKILPIKIETIERVGGGSVRCMMAGFFDYPK